MTTKKITVTISDVPVELTLRSAKISDGLWRGELISQAINSKEEKTNRQKINDTILYPTCICCVLEPAWVREMTPEAFMNNVEDRDAPAWMDAAYELNPHWKTIYEAAPDAEKKTGTRLTGSQPSTTKARKRHRTSPA
jgi:hypothetical protein